MGSNSNPVATITNKLGFDVDIYDVYNPSADGKLGGLLTYTKLASVPNGASSQKVQTMRTTSTLQAMRTGSIKALNGNYYHQFPVAEMAVNRFLADIFTLTSDMQQSMEQSYKFIKYVQANATSALAKDFATALASTGQRAAVDKFFQGTGSFKQCSMSSWITVFNWQTQFTNAWQGTYYLYSLGDTTTKTPPALVATLVVSSSAKANSAVLTMANSNNQNVGVAMVGDGTMQDSNPGGDNVSVSLTPTWMNVTQTSQQNGKAVTTYVIGVVFTGTISGIKVTGNMNQMTFPKDTQSQDSKDCKNSANSFSMNTLFQIAGLLVSVGMLYQMAKEHKNKETQKANDAEDGATSGEDANSRRQRSETSSEAASAPELQREASSASSPRSSVTDAYTGVVQAQNAQAQVDVIQTQVENLVNVMEIEPASGPIENAADNLFDAQTDVTKATDTNMSVAERSTVLDTSGTKIETVGTTLTQQLKDGEIQVSEESEKSLKETSEAIQEQTEQSDAMDEAVKEKAKENEEKKSEDEVNEDNFDNEDAQGESGEGGEGFRGE